jgi:hypothetical protein
MDSKPASTQPENPPSENSPLLEKDSRTTAVYHTVYYPRTVKRRARLWEIFAESSAGTQTEP